MQQKFHRYVKNTSKVTYKEIDEMIHTVDKNGDGKINYSEFRVMMGAHPLIQGVFFNWASPENVSRLAPPINPSTGPL